MVSLAEIARCGKIEERIAVEKLLGGTRVFETSNSTRKICSNTVINEITV